MLTAAAIVARSLIAQLSVVGVTCAGAEAKSGPPCRFSNGRVSITVRRSSNAPTAAFVVPSRDAIFKAIFEDIATAETVKLTTSALKMVSDLHARLQTYCPSAQLLVDFSSIARCYGDDVQDHLDALATLTYRKSESVIQRIIGAIGLGWDGRLGTIVRKAISSVLVRAGGRGSDPALVYIPTTGQLVYTVDLASGRAHRRGLGDVTLSSRSLSMASARNAQPEKSSSNNQHVGALATEEGHNPRGLLSSHEVASTLILELLTYHTQDVAKAVSAQHALACWSTLETQGKYRCRAGDVLQFRIQARNVFHKNTSKGGEPFQVLTIFAPSQTATATDSDTTPTVTVSISDRSNGRYLIDAKAPSKAGTFTVAAALNEQPINGSPAHIVVEAAPWSPSLTSVAKPFTTVVAGLPFTVVLQLRDRFGNALSRIDPKKEVVAEQLSGAPNAASLLSVKGGAAGTLCVSFVVPTASPAVVIAVRLRSALNAAEAPFILNVNAAAVDQPTFLRWLAWRTKSAGPAMEKKKQHDRVALYFRKSMRASERKRLAAEGIALKLGSDAAATVAFPADTPMSRQALSKTLQTAASKPLPAGVA